MPNPLRVERGSLMAFVNDKRLDPIVDSSLSYFCFFLNSSWLLDTVCIVLLVMVLFPNIFYFLIGILSVFVTLRSALRLCSKNK